MPSRTTEDKWPLRSNELNGLLSPIFTDAEVFPCTTRAVSWGYFPLEALLLFLIGLYRLHIAVCVPLQTSARYVKEAWDWFLSSSLDQFLSTSSIPPTSDWFSSCHQISCLSLHLTDFCNHQKDSSPHYPICFTPQFKFTFSYQVGHLVTSMR